jgi:predicted nucleotidyltransferase
MKIFTLEDFVTCSLPRIESFLPAFEDFENSCLIPFLGEEVIGYFRYGSTNTKEFNVSSDVDVLILVKNRPHMRFIGETQKRIKEETNVDIETRVITLDRARTKTHNLDNSFLQHLLFTSKTHGHMGNNPMTHIVPNNISLKQSIRESVAHYLRELYNFETNPPTSDSQRLEHIGKIIRKPYHVVRMAIQYALGDVSLDTSKFNDSKQELMKTYSELGFLQSAIRHLSKINSTIQIYNALLIDRLDEVYPLEELEPIYSAILTKMEEHHDDAVNFIEFNLKIMTSMPFRWHFYRR